MALHIIIGGPTRQGPFHQVYAGPSGAESRAAMEASGAAVFGILDNPQIRFKNNSHAAAPASPPTEATAPESPADQPPADPPPAPAGGHRSRKSAA